VRRRARPSCRGVGRVGHHRVGTAGDGGAAVTRGHRPWRRPPAGGHSAPGPAEEEVRLRGGGSLAFPSGQAGVRGKRRSPRSQPRSGLGRGVPGREDLDGWATHRCVNVPLTGAFLRTGEFPARPRQGGTASTAISAIPLGNRAGPGTTVPAPRSAASFAVAGSAVAEPDLCPLIRAGASATDGPD